MATPLGLPELGLDTGSYVVPTLSTEQWLNVLELSCQKEHCFFLICVTARDDDPEFFNRRDMEIMPCR